MITKEKMLSDLQAVAQSPLCPPAVKPSIEQATVQLRHIPELVLALGTMLSIVKIQNGNLYDDINELLKDVQEVLTHYN